MAFLLQIQKEGSGHGKDLVPSSFSARRTYYHRRAVPGGTIMKLRFATLTAATLFAAALTMAADGSWTGYISDSQCGVKGANDKAGECTTKCVKEHGAKYVFVNDADKKVYAIDAQDKVAAHAGHHVTVKGSVDGDTLKLSSIDMAAAKSM
jgi:hypothetical protein